MLDNDDRVPTMVSMQSPHDMNATSNDDAYVVEEEEVSEATSSEKIKSLKMKLTEVQKESAENLAGWQRAKADLINYRRSVEMERATERTRVVHEVLRDIIPVLDSFEGAMAHEEWKNADETWRTGVEQIATQLHRVLEERGVELFGIVGETFDPRLHECVGVATAHASGSADTVATVLQKGYKSGDIVLRPAKVVVAQAVHGDTT